MSRCDHIFHSRGGVSCGRCVCECGGFASPAGRVRWVDPDPIWSGFGSDSRSGSRSESGSGSESRSGSWSGSWSGSGSGSESGSRAGSRKCRTRRALPAGDFLAYRNFGICDNTQSYDFMIKDVVCFKGTIECNNR